MDPIVVAGQFFLGLAVTLFLFWPYIRTLAVPERDTDFMEMRQANKSSVHQVLEDLEYDYATGKLSEDDYRHLKKTVLAESKEELRLEKQQSRADNVDSSVDDVLEDAVRRARESLTD